MQHDPILLGSITDATDAVRGHVIVSGSHGGLYPAAVASQALPRGVFFHDAGIGLEQAGIAGVMALDRVALAAVAVDGKSCTIGSAGEMLQRGRVSHPNQTALHQGVRPGMAVAQAAQALANAPLPKTTLPPVAELRKTVRIAAGRDVELLDSASLVNTRDAGKIVITGSHGGLIGGNPARALKAKARIACFNDAGFTPADIAKSRLPALDRAGVAAVLISCETARIGDALSSLETGQISFANALAEQLGAKTGLHLKTWLEMLPD